MEPAPLPAVPVPGPKPSSQALSLRGETADEPRLAIPPRVVLSGKKMLQNLTWVQTI